MPAHLPSPLHLPAVFTLAKASLTADERALHDRFATELRQRLGGELHAIWLVGSRARGERPAENDVDLLVLVDLFLTGRRRRKGSRNATPATANVTGPGYAIRA